MRDANATLSRHNRTAVWLAAAAALLIWATPDIAQAQLTKEEEEYLKEKKDGPESIYLIAARTRAVGMPSFIWDLFFDRHSSHWEDRANLSFGLEFVLRKPSYDLVFGADFVDYSQPSDWFLEKDDPARKADFTTFPFKIVQLTVGVNWYFPISEVFAFYTGGGLGAGLVIGEMQKTDPSPECLAFLQNLDGDPTNDGDPNDFKRLDQEPCVDADGNPQVTPGSTEIEEDIPPVVPLVNINLGTQFTFGEHFVWRIEAGTNLLYFYAGMSLGAQWW